MNKSNNKLHPHFFFHQFVLRTTISRLRVGIDSQFGPVTLIVKILRTKARLLQEGRDVDKLQRQYEGLKRGHG